MGSILSKIYDEEMYKSPSFKNRERRIDSNNRVEKELLKTYESIDIFAVIKETLLCKGEKVVSKDFFIPKKLLEDSALYLYELKANSTNKLYIGMTIDKLCLRNDLCHEKSDKLVKVPKEIYDEVKSINDKYRK